MFPIIGDYTLFSDENFILFATNYSFVASSKYAVYSKLQPVSRAKQQMSYPVAAVDFLQWQVALRELLKVGRPLISKAKTVHFSVRILIPLVAETAKQVVSCHLRPLVAECRFHLLQKNIYRSVQTDLTVCLQNWQNLHK